MLLAFLLALLVGLGIVQIWQMAVIIALSRVCVTFEMPSRQVFLYDLVGRSSLMNAIALNSGLFNAAMVLGPALAGLCLARFGAHDVLRPERAELPGGDRGAAFDPHDPPSASRQRQGARRGPRRLRLPEARQAHTRAVSAVGVLRCGRHGLLRLDAGLCPPGGAYASVSATAFYSP